MHTVCGTWFAVFGEIHGEKIKTDSEWIAPIAEFFEGKENVEARHWASYVYSCIAPECKYINECETGEHNCHADADCHDLPNSSEEGFECKCSSGFEGDGVEKCVDIDECAKDANICDTEVFHCKNTHGSYECLCNPLEDYKSGND